jgi:hypothetical protein
MSAEADCELCGAKLPTLTQLRRHLGKHHEELSLFALPSHMKEDDEEAYDNHAKNDSVSSVAGSNDSPSPKQISCEECGLNFDDDHENRQLALDFHMQNVHGYSKTRISSIDETDLRFVKAKELLREKPSIVQALDEQMFDETLIHHCVRLYLPEDVNTWKQLKDWVGEHILDLDYEQIPVLQAIQFQTIVGRDRYPDKDYYSNDELGSVYRVEASVDTIRREELLPTGLEPLKGHSKLNSENLTYEGQETWQCTFCYQHLVPEYWRDHEETQHYPMYRWTCLATGPRLLTHVYGLSMCAFCQLKDPDEHHLLSQHRMQECLARTEDERTFVRPDHLRQHVRNFHKSSLFDQARDRWRKNGRKEHEWWMCGFCNEKLTTWDMRATHIADHFKKGFTMAYWQDTNRLEDLSTPENLPVVLGKNGLPPSPSIQDDTPGPSMSPSIQDVDMLPIIPNPDAIITDAQVDGVPDLRPEIWARVQLSGDTLTFWNPAQGGVLKNQWRVQYADLQGVSLHEDHVHLRGLLQVPDKLPELKDFTMTFNEKSKAEFICAELTRAIEHNAISPKDEEPVIREPTYHVPHHVSRSENVILDDDLKNTLQFEDIKFSCSPDVAWAGSTARYISLRSDHEALSFVPHLPSQMTLQMKHSLITSVRVTARELVIKGVLGTYRRPSNEADSIHKSCVVTLEAGYEDQAEEIVLSLRGREVANIRGREVANIRSGRRRPGGVLKSPIIAPSAPRMSYMDYEDLFPSAESDAHGQFSGAHDIPETADHIVRDHPGPGDPNSGGLGLVVSPEHDSENPATSEFSTRTWETRGCVGEGGLEDLDTSFLAAAHFSISDQHIELRQQYKAFRIDFDFITRIQFKHPTIFAFIGTTRCIFVQLADNEDAYAVQLAIENVLPNLIIERPGNEDVMDSEMEE